MRRHLAGTLRRGKLDTAAPGRAWTAMSLRWRKLLGTMAVVLFLVAYSLLAMVLGGTLLVGQPHLVELVGFIALGLLWLPGAMAIIRWMSRGSTG